MTESKGETRPGRDRLLGEARALFMARGYADVSMQEIADAADLSKAAPYHHFRDKEDLFLEIFRWEMNRLREGIVAILSTEEPFRTRLINVVTFLLDSSQRQFAQLVADLDRHVSADRKRALLRNEPPPTALFQPFFERAAAAGAFRRAKPDVAATAFLAVILGLFELARHEEIFDAAVSVEVDGIETLVDILLEGF